MIAIFYQTSNHHIETVHSLEGIDKNRVVWIDLCSPEPHEIKMVELVFDLDLPSRDDVQEIETSSRLYEENGAYFMTMNYVAHALDTDPFTTQITFVARKNVLVTVRYETSRLISHFMERMTVPNGDTPRAASQIMVSLLDMIVDYAADVLEHSAAAIEKLHARVFSSNTSADYKSMLREMARIQSLNSRMQDSLTSMIRLQLYIGQVLQSMRAHSEVQDRMTSLGSDLQSLVDKTTATTGSMTFLLDATLGLVSIEQNAIIKIFSVAAVIFLPPTLIASVYGMNFDHMPELAWPFGYPMAVALMIVSAIAPYLFFKKKGWL